MIPMTTMTPHSEHEPIHNDRREHNVVAAVGTGVRLFGKQRSMRALQYGQYTLTRIARSPANSVCKQNGHVYVRYAPYDVDALEEDDGLEEAARMSDWTTVLARARAALERSYVRIKPHIASGA